MESTVAQKLDSLKKLQQIDSKLDDIVKIRGALPEEVGDLEDEIVGYQTRIAKHNSEVENQNEQIANNKNAIVEANKLIKKYSEQQMNVRNNREYDAITKESELQALEIQICEKRIKEAQLKIEANAEIEETIATLEERKKDLESKKKELIMITSESLDEENKLKEGREKAASKVEERLLNSYNKIRNNANNGLGVVSITRSACGGCFNIVPPQRQAEVRERKKIIVCEHCGRIFVDIEDLEIPEEKKTKRAKK